MRFADQPNRNKIKDTLSFSFDMRIKSHHSTFPTITITVNNTQANQSNFQSKPPTLCQIYFPLLVARENQINTGIAKAEENQN